jgi:hypothetical protein
LCLALGEFIARSNWSGSLKPRLLVGVFGVLVAGLHFGFVPWYAEARSPVGVENRVAKYVNDPTVKVVTYPRNLDSVAFYSGRADFDRVRSKEVNQFLVDCHFRPKTVILFTHGHSYEAFRQALPPSLKIVTHETFQRETKSFSQKLAGSSPWGLCDVAVIEPVTLQHR